MTLQNTITVNGRQYKAPELTYNAVCELQSMGVDIRKQGDILNAVRGYFALIIGDKMVAGDEIEEHIVNGGNLDELMLAFSKAVEESRFFQAMAGLPKENSPPKKPPKSSE